MMDLLDEDRNGELNDDFPHRYVVSEGELHHIMEEVTQLLDMEHYNMKEEKMLHLYSTKPKWMFDIIRQCYDVEPVSILIEEGNQQDYHQFNAMTTAAEYIFGSRVKKFNFREDDQDVPLSLIVPSVGHWVYKKGALGYVNANINSNEYISFNISDIGIKIIRK
jgi:hypothetical protein